MLVSGYPGSPLAGLDLEFARHARLLAELDVALRAGLNEELAATAVWGSQLASSFARVRFEGVSGIWYGKAPGLDRAADAVRHGNYVGVSPTGGVLLAVGDDPSCKSSSLPSASETTLAALNIPTLYPGSVAEILTFGLHALACSRACGVWVALKMTTNVADGVASVVPAQVVPVVPGLELDGRPYTHRPSGHLLAPWSVEMERNLFGARLPGVEEYARLNSLNQIEGATGTAWLGLVASGKTYVDVRQALRDLGVADDEFDRLGVRLLKVGMIYPVERAVVEEFASGLEEVLVLDEKQPFLEPALRRILYGSSHQPRVYGKGEVPDTAPLSQHGELDQDAIAPLLAAALARRGDRERFRARLERIRNGAVATSLAGVPARTPFFCSGCPHNRSTSAPSDSLVGAGIGCHSLVLLSPHNRAQVTAMTQMGGEGAQWIGISPFVEAPHLVQNVGDGTFHHSASLAIRAAVAAGVNITYKLLYNGAVAMTGGQVVEGGLTVPALTQLLEAEGVVRTIVTTDDTSRYRGLSLARNAELRSRDELSSIQEELRQVSGVTVLIHDQQCALEKRRLRRHAGTRAKLRVVINERVCEGCGDCGAKSSCLSVTPVESEFGRKTQIHQSSCNEDLSCLLGDCPSFVTIESSEDAPPPIPVPPKLPNPPGAGVEGEFRMRMVGIGGTGTVTLARIIATAAVLDGYHANGLDQTGLSQKGGAVVSDLTLQTTARIGAGRASAGSVDLYLGLDIIGAANSRYLSAASSQRSHAVVSTTLIPTAAMVVGPSVPPDPERLIALIERHTRRASNVYLDAVGLSERLFRDHTPANLIVLGAAWQSGVLPLSRAALEKAITAVRGPGDEGVLAFTWGRAWVAAPGTARALLEQAPEVPTLSRRQRDLLASAGFSGELLRLAEIRVGELTAYQSLDYARAYVEFLVDVADREQRIFGGSELSEIVARQLFKLMAYKDEYEVARLHLLTSERERLQRLGMRSGKARWHLHPPLLRALGLRRKIRVGPWILPVFRLLHVLRHVRGTLLDIFGWTSLRRLERQIIDEYKGALVAAFSSPAASAQPDVVRELCASPDAIRGYEEIKRVAIRRWQYRVYELLFQLDKERTAAA